MDETMALLTGLLGIVFATGLFGSALYGAWLWGRERGREEGRLERQRELAGPTGDRLDGVERALESLSQEMERLGEDQRFAMRLLADPGSARRAEGRSGNSEIDDVAKPETPHPH